MICIAQQCRLIYLFPVKPMSSEACKAYSKAFEKCKSQIIYVDVKYDGERVQIHYNATECKFYSIHQNQSKNKIKDVQQDTTRACPNAETLILDSQTLM